MPERILTEFEVIFNEVCKNDYYGIRSIPFIPDVVFDLGANVGAFTTFARCLFPEADIIAVEPDPRNFKILKMFTGHLPGIYYISKALGTGTIWKGIPNLVPPYYGATRSYVTQDQIGFMREEMVQPPGGDGRDDMPIYEPTAVESIGLPKLLTTYVELDETCLLKMDCEGGENCIFDDQVSMVALRAMDFVTMETHYYTKGTGTQHEANAKAVDASLLSLSDTHDCQLNKDKRHFQALRKGINV